MNKDISEFIGRAKKLSENNGLASGIAGSPKHMSIMNDLYSAAIKLREADSTAQADEQLDEIVGVLHVAQAMNVIGFNDLEELMDLLDKIKSEDS